MLEAMATHVNAGRALIFTTRDRYAIGETIGQERFGHPFMVVREANRPDKYDETAAAMIAQLKYGSGIPFYRMESLEDQLGIPLPAWPKRIGFGQAE
jgi:hypothetical protein